MRNLKKFLALVLATLMVVGAMVATTVSAAEADHSKAVTVLNRVDVYRGYGKDVMGENDLVTRWHMALFVSRMTTGFTDDSHWNGDKNDTPFTDVTKNNYLGAISSAYKAGIILGIGDNKFDPNANIKYVDALTMVVRALGYKDLDYPLGFVQKAQALGLTDNLNELDNKLDTAITRGQTAEIIYNALFVECKDGTILARDVLKLQLADGIVVGTPKQALEASQLAPAGKVILSLGNNKYLTLNASLLLEEDEDIEDLLGYSFKVATNNNWETLVTSFRCASKTLYNYGEEKNEISYVQYGYAPNLQKRLTMIKLEGVNYNWNDATTSSSATRFVAYKLSAHGYDKTKDPETIKIHYHNANGDIVDTNGKILLYYIDGKYWKNVSATANEALVSATDDEILAAKRDYAPGALTNTYSFYDIIPAGQSDVVWDNKFCELKVFDDNGDGKWDRGIFTPYYFGQYTPKDNGYLNISDNDNNEKVVVDGTMKDAVISGKNTNVKVTGKDVANGDYIFYTFNNYTGVFEVKKNLEYKIGKATETNGRGSYAVIDGAKQIYSLTEQNLCGFKSNYINLSMIQQVIADKTYTIGYVAEAGYLLTTGISSPFTFSYYVAFAKTDIVKIDNAGNLVVKAIIDATGVKKEIKISDMYQYNPEAKYNKPAKIGAIIAFELKKMEVVQSGDGNSELANFMEGASAPAAQATKVTNAQIVEAYNNAVDGKGLDHKMADYLNTTVFAGRINADGTYSLVPFTPFVNYNPMDPVNKYDKDVVNIVDNKNPATITINYGINDKPYVSEVAAGDALIAQAGKFDTTSSVVYIFAGKDKIQVFKGVAKDGSQINLTGDKTVLLNATADCVFVYDETKTAEALADKFKGTEVTDQPENPDANKKDYEFFAVVADTKVSMTEANAEGKVSLTVTDLQNVFTGETKSLKWNNVAINEVKGIYNAINEKYPITNVSKASGKIFFISEKDYNGGYHYEFNSYVAFEKLAEVFDGMWSNEKYKEYFKVNLGNLNDGFMIDVEAGDDIPVQSYALTIFWGDGTVETIDGITKTANLTELTIKDEGGNVIDTINSDKAFIAVDKDGKATGYVFAPDRGPKSK